MAPDIIRDVLGKYLVARPTPIHNAYTIQLLVRREALDYTILRTEEAHEINSAVVPYSDARPEGVVRAAFLASKQRAVETRQLERLLRTAVAEVSADLTLRPPPVPCYHKSKLCMRCPRCALFGAANIQAGQEPRNIKHRIGYGVALSCLPYAEVVERHTFNGIDDTTQTTGSAFNTRAVVRPATVFMSAITLTAVTWHEFVLAIKTVLSARAYGAETRIGGDMRNTIVGIIGGWEPVITPLELTAYLGGRAQTAGYTNADALTADMAVIGAIAAQFRLLAGNPHAITICTPTQVDALVVAAAEQPLDAVFMQAAYEASYAFFE